MFTNTLESMRVEMLRRRYSPRTVESYLFCIERFLKKIGKEPRRIRKKDVKDYLDRLALGNKAGSTMNVHLSAIKFLIEEVLHRNFYLNMRYSRRPKTLPVYLTKEETRKLFDAVKNPKHRLMLELMYSAGLRVSELLNLKVKDFEFQEGYGWVRHGKGNKDRPFIIADRLKERIVNFIEDENLGYGSYLFAGNNSSHLSIRTVQEICKTAARKAGIRKQVHPHTLRHSFATHSVEEGSNLTDLQALLGHSSIQTTMVYAHTSAARMINIKSPFDSL